MKYGREMKKIIPYIIICFIGMPALASTSENQVRRSMATQFVQAAPRATASTNQISAMANASAGAAVVDMSSVRVPAGTVTANDDATDNEEKPSVPNNNSEYERQKAACLNNNIGIGNTFVWASRYSNTNNYSSMVEDVNNPENNVCFVLVDIKSADPKINVSDILSKYFQMGQNITCGSWANEDTLRQRILDAKKSNRTWATVGGAVGGAALGVGAMELFGNRLIGGSVMGQKQADISDDDRLLMQLRALKNDSPSEFEQFMSALESLQKACDEWEGENKPSECNRYNYKKLINAKN